MLSFENGEEHIIFSRPRAKIPAVFAFTSAQRSLTYFEGTTV